MIIAAPLPFHEALDLAEVKALLRTTGVTRDLQRLAPQLKRRAFFMAGVHQAGILQIGLDGVRDLLSGQVDQATVRLGLKQLLEGMGYAPAKGDEGTIKDLRTTARLNVMLETNVAIMRGAGWHEQGMQPDVLDEFPARELYDTAPGGEHRRDWSERWLKAGGELVDGRMVALATAPVWSSLGDPSLFPDGLGNPWPPFAFNSAWRVRDIGRDEAQALGLIDANTELLPQPLDLNADLQATPDVRDERLRAALEDSGLGTFTRGGVFRFTPTS